MKNFSIILLLTLVLPMAIVGTFTSCKKDSPFPIVSLTECSGEWERGKNVYNLEFDSKVAEIRYVQGVPSPEPFNGGFVKQFYDGELQKYGHIMLQYVWQDSTTKDILFIGQFDYLLQSDVEFVGIHSAEKNLFSINGSWFEPK